MSSNFNNRFVKYENIKNKIKNIIQDKPYSEWKTHIKKSKLVQGKSSIVFDFKDIDCILKVIPVSAHALLEINSNIYAVWRELNAVRWTTNMIKRNMCPNYPLVYYWKIVENCCDIFQNSNFSDSSGLFIFFERADMNLFDWLNNFDKKILKDNTKQPITNLTLNESRWKSLMFQVIFGIYAINERYGIVHRDLHWKNILCTKYSEIDNNFFVYVIRNISYFVPTHGMQYYICDFGKNMRKADQMMQSDMPDILSDSSRNVYIEGEDKQWVDFHVYRSKQKVEDIYRFSHLPEWLIDNNIDINIIPKSILDLFHLIKNTWTVKEYKNIDEIILEGMSEFLDPRIGEKWDGQYSDTGFANAGYFVVYEKKLALVIHSFGNNMSIVTSRHPFKIMQVLATNVRMARVPRRPPNWKGKIINRFNLAY
tara:strand:+ start:3794 stop:5065 length:1272 start_codon:yes stop_codon:yes gene_type:complete